MSSAGSGLLAADEYYGINTLNMIKSCCFSFIKPTGMIVFWTNAGMVFIGSCNVGTSQDSSHNRRWQGSLGKGRAITGNFEEILRRQAKICDGQIAIVARDTPRKVLVYR
jgi:hypothetical protein